ncbi:MAG: hypothetical protein ACOC15_01765 [Desulfovibrionales bacterium]
MACARSVIRAGWFLVWLGMAVLLPLAAQAQQDSNQTAEPARIRDVPETSVGRPPLPVRIEHTGVDQLGIRLAYAMRETFNRSGLFRLSQQNQQSLRVLLTTRNEFTDRPGLSSVFSVVWLFSTGEGVLSHYLNSEVGFVSPDEVQAQAEVLVARTDSVASSYVYLFED